MSTQTFEQWDDRGYTRPVRQHQLHRRQHQLHRHRNLERNLERQYRPQLQQREPDLQPPLQHQLQAPILTMPVQPYMMVQPHAPAMAPAMAPQIAPAMAPTPLAPTAVFGYYYPFAYAPRMQPTSLPSPRLDGAAEDYEENAMAEFLAQSAYHIMSEGSSVWCDQEFDSFQRFAQGVLRATRLSRHTILLSLQYLAHRWSLGNFADPSECDYDMYYLMFVVSLVLANKLHDDNTFTNASWFEATGIPAAQLTRAETHWLAALDWNFDIHDTSQWFQWHDRYQSFLYHRQQRSPATPPGIWAPSYTQVAAF